MKKEKELCNHNKISAQIDLNKPAYRKDIDGLRAVAVCSVVCFHAFPNKLTGGFTGVDIFFVISGFLISSIIFKGLESRSFSFADFFARRIRRIFPALLCVLLFCLVAGWFVLLHAEYAVLGKHLAAGAAYISNFILWSESGYFDTAAVKKPLLHLWSLAIEEQFYIVWPLFLWLAYKRNIHLFTLIFFSAIISGLFCLYTVNKDVVAGFYAPWNRVWELMFGSLLAWIMLYTKESITPLIVKIDTLISKCVYQIPTQNNNCFANFVSIFGAVLLAVGIYCTNTSMPFPGKWTLFPVLGAVFLIAAGPSAWFNRVILANPVAVFIGVISYPLYLWHWPLLSLANIVESETPSRIIRIACVLLSFVLAWLTYRFVEPPLRYGKNGNIKALFLLFGLIFVGAAGYSVYKFEGIQQRFNDAKNLQTKLEADKKLQNRLNDSYLLGNNIFPEWLKLNDNACRFQSPAGENTIALIGDSHAGHLYPGLLEKVTKGNSVVSFAASCAAPYLNILCAASDKKLWMRQHTEILIKQAYDHVLKDKKIKVVVLAHNPECSFYDIVDINEKNEKDRTKILKKAMYETFTLLKKENKKVIVVLDNPTLPYDPQKYSSRPFRISSQNRFSSFDKQEDQITNSKNWYNNIVNDVAKNFSNITIFDSATLFLEGNTYQVVKNGELLYTDINHLSFAGSRFVAKALWPLIEIKLNEQ